MADPSKRFEKSVSYIASQIERSEREKGQVRSGPAITMSRETGSGAITLADRLVEHLNEHTDAKDCHWTVFDKNLVAKVLEDHDLPTRLEKFMPEDSPDHVRDTVGDMLGIHPPNWALVKRTGETIYRLARMGSCILVGRGANIITRGLPNVLHIRLVGALDKRITRCAEYYGISEAEATEFIKKQDRARRRYLLAYYDEEIEDPANYHLVINVDRFTPDGLVRMEVQLSLFGPQHIPMM